MLDIELLNIKYINYKEMIIEIYYTDYKIVDDNKTIYDIEVLSYKGIKNIINNIIEFKYIIGLITISLIIILILSNMIFKIEVVTNDVKMEKKIVSFLNKNGLKKYHFKKSFKEIKKVKKEIIKRYKNEIEWIEIETFGTKYVVRYEPRIISKLKSNSDYQSIVAKRDAIIYDMNIKSGQIIKNRNDYVRKGDVIVSGYIYLNEEIKDTKKAEGNIYGETWYKIKVIYPMKYYNEKKTGKKKNIIFIKFLTKDFELFNFNKYKNYDVKNKTIIKNSMLPISINYQTQEQLKVIKENNTKKEAEKKAVEYALKKVKEKLKNNEYVKDYKVINSSQEDNQVTVNLFFSLIEDITDYMKIEEYKNIDSEEFKNNTIP